MTMPHLSRPLYATTSARLQAQTSPALSKPVFVLLLGLSLLLVLFRLNGLAPISNYLWAEDGALFLSQAQSLGIASIWEPYAGYLHLYPRLITYIAYQLPLIYRPDLMFFGWIAAYLLSLTLIIQQTARLGLQVIPLIFLILIISLQPNFGEVYFTVANAQWCLGAAFFFWVLSYTQAKGWRGLIQLITLLILALTGPFSLLVLPALLLKALIFKDVKQNFLSYALVFCCGLFQLSLLIATQYQLIANPQPYAPLGVWLKTFAAITLFNVITPIKLTAALLFWAVFIVSLFLDRSSFKLGRRNFIIASLCFMTAAIIIFTAALKVKSNPLYLVVLGSGTRYTWIAYTLSLCGIAIATMHRRSIQLVLALLILVVFKQDIHVYARGNLQFKSFANLANYQSIFIPSNPQAAMYPGWNLLTPVPRHASLASLPQYSLSLTKFLPVNVNANMANNQLLQLNWQANNPQLLYKEKIDCKKAADIGLKIVIDHSHEGWMMVYWSPENQFTEKNSLKNWYPAGKITAYYAFPNIASGNYIRLDPNDTPNAVASLSEVTAYCLP